MKKAMIAFTTLLITTTAHAFGFFFPDSVYVPCLQERFVFELGGTELRANIPQNDYALLYPNADSLELGKYKSIDPTYHFGYTILLGYVFPDSGNDVHLTFTGRNGTDENSARRSQDGVLFRTLSNVNLSTTIFVIAQDLTNPVPPSIPFLQTIISPNIPIDAAVAKNEVNYQTLDFDLGQHIKVYNNLKFRLKMGFSYAHLDKTLDVRYFGTTDVRTLRIFSNLDTGITETAIFDSNFSVIEQVKQNSFFNGIGPKLGFEFKYKFRRDFGINGSMASALLVGHVESYLSEIQNNITRTLVTIILDPNPLGRVPPPPFTQLDDTTLSQNFFQKDTFRVVPELEGKLGINYTFPQYRWTCSIITLEGGYQVNHYFNAVDNLSTVGGSQPEFRTRRAQSMHFEGPYFSVQILI